MFTFSFKITSSGIFLIWFSPSHLIGITWIKLKALTFNFLLLMDPMFASYSIPFFTPLNLWLTLINKILQKRKKIKKNLTWLSFQEKIKTNNLLVLSSSCKIVITILTFLQVWVKSFLIEPETDHVTKVDHAQSMHEYLTRLLTWNGNLPYGRNPDFQGK